MLVVCSTLVFVVASLGLHWGAEAQESSNCAHDLVIHAFNEHHENNRFLRLVDANGDDILPHKLSRQELRRELADRGVERLADDHRRKLAGTLDDVRGRTWKPLRILYKKIDWPVDPSMHPKRQSFLAGILDEAVEIFHRTFFVRRAPGNTKVSRSCQTVYEDGKCAHFVEDEQCGSITGDSNIDIPEYMFDDAEVCSAKGCSTFDGGDGEDADFVLYVSAKATSTCGPDVLGYALACKHDEIERPIMGRANFCPYSLKLDQREKALNVALHEIMHALGFSKNYFWRWRNPATLEPLTARDADGMPSGDNSAQCNFNDVYFPAASVAETFSERGFDKCSSKAERFDNNNCVTKIVTPLSVEAAKWYTGCESMQGIELENQVPGTCHNTGSHMEQRVYEGNLMTPIITLRPGMSGPVLAMMEDSGWYKANWTSQDTYVKGNDWAYKLGCGFSKDDKCITDDEKVVPGGEGRFCAEKNTDSLCTWDHSALAYCDMVTHSGNLDSKYRYFEDARRGGSIKHFDYCPTINPFTNGLCSVEGQSFAAEQVGQDYGKDSLCFMTTAAYPRAGKPEPYRGRCIKAKCAQPTPGNYTLTLEFYVNDPFGNKEKPKATCFAKETIPGPPGYHGTIDCPDPYEICHKSTDLFIPTGQSTSNGWALPSPSSTVGPLPSSSPSPTTAPPCPSSTASPSPRQGGLRS